MRAVEAMMATPLSWKSALCWPWARGRSTWDIEINTVEKKSNLGFYTNPPGKKTREGV